jgi:hypothetical protein
MSTNDTAAISHLVKKLGLTGSTARSIVAKAMEYLRKYNSKMGRGSGVLGNAHIAKPSVSVDLACTSGEVFVDVAVDVAVLQKWSGVTPAQFKKVRSVMMKVLDLKQCISARDVCIQFGCLKLEPVIRETLEEFSIRVESDRKEKDDGGKSEFDIRSPRIVGAAFTLVAKAYKTKFDRNKLLHALGIQQKEYRGALQFMSTVMKDVFFDESVDSQS